MHLAVEKREIVTEQIMRRMNYVQNTFSILELYFELKLKTFKNNFKESHFKDKNASLVILLDKELYTDR